MIEKLKFNAEHYPDKKAFVHIENNQVLNSITHKELLERAGKIAGCLQEYDCYNERMLLMLPSSLDYIIAFYAAMLVHAVSVPVYTISNSHHKERLSNIIENADAHFILTNRGQLDKIQTIFEEYTEDVEILCIEDLVENEAVYEEQEYDLEEIAYLQYTSGSTQNAKGVKVSYKCILSNEECIKKKFGFDSSEIVVSWLPFYHDMGLIGNVILTNYLGSTCYFMNPLSFIQKPVNWLKAISDYRATYVTAPNFAYQLCIDEVSDVEKLDLSSLRCAINGAEPIRKSTIDRFYQKYRCCGLEAEVMNPSYGLAENTLLAAAYEPGEKIFWKTVNPDQFSDNQVAFSDQGIDLVASGTVAEGNLIKIVDSNTHKALEERRIGEIWIASDSATKGYWNNEAVNAQYFQKRVDGYEEEFFSTGDMGFIEKSHLFIIGRSKDMIIIRGKNFYPQDIELSSENSHESVVNNSVAAFSIDKGDEEVLVIVAEIRRNLRDLKNDTAEIKKKKQENRQAVIRAIYETVASKHEIKPEDVLLIQEKSIPKTSSGKIQRSLCRKMYLNDELKMWERAAIR